MRGLQLVQQLNRRQFLAPLGFSLGAIAFGSLLSDDRVRSAPPAAEEPGGLPGLPHFVAKARRVIYLFQSGAPSQVDLFDYKPGLAERRGTELPASVRMGQRLTTFTSNQASLPVAPSFFRFVRHGESGTWLSELLPHTGRVVDQLCLIKSMTTKALNHDPAVTFFQTGSQIPGRPTLGAWVAYGLGSMNRDLPAFIVLVSNGTGNPGDQPIYDRLWSSAFLPSRHQGVRLRSGREPVLYVENPAGVTRQTRRHILDDLSQLNQLRYAEMNDPEILTRIAQYELAYRMQSAVPELTDISREPEAVLQRYGPEVRRPGTFAANCLLARRLAERGVRFIQLFHKGWDHHSNLPTQIRGQCYDIDQPSAALIMDLKQRGLLDDTLVIWGGEFGRTIYSQGQLTDKSGRDHHPYCFTIWLAGGGIKPGISYGQTDDFSYNTVADAVDVHDLHATILHLLGIDHTRLTYRFQGRDFRLTDVSGNVVRGILA
jgi:hypothetical protein